MRRAVSAVLALLLLCIALPAAAKTLGEDPDLFRLFIQNRYDVVIRMGDECGEPEEPSPWLTVPVAPVAPPEYFRSTILKKQEKRV